MTTDNSQNWNQWQKEWNEIDAQWLNPFEYQWLDPFEQWGYTKLNTTAAKPPQNTKQQPLETIHEPKIKTYPFNAFNAIEPSLIAEHDKQYKQYGNTTEPHSTAMQTAR